jgi:hypothetical protein
MIPVTMLYRFFGVVVYTRIGLNDAFLVVTGLAVLAGAIWQRKSIILEAGYPDHRLAQHLTRIIHKL